MKTKTIFTILAFVCATLIVACKSGVKDTTVEEIQEEITEQSEYVPSIEEILQYREDLREYERQLHVFYTMPSVVLVDILQTHGTSLMPSEIVDIYESNPERYNVIESGARARQYLDSLVEKKSLKDLADSLMAPLNSIKKQEPIDSVISSW